MGLNSHELPDFRITRRIIWCIQQIWLGGKPKRLPPQKSWENNLFDDATITVKLGKELVQDKLLGRKRILMILCGLEGLEVNAI